MIKTLQVEYIITKLGMSYLTLSMVRLTSESDLLNKSSRLGLT